MSGSNPLLWAAGLLVGYCLVTGGSAAAVQVLENGDEPLQIGGYRQLFLDDYIIAERINCCREFNEVEKADFNPIITCDMPWERDTGGYYIERMSMVNDEEEGMLKMWYEVYLMPSGVTRVCYATSRDGIHWDKPNLGLVEFEGSKDNNIIPFSKDRHVARFVEKDPNASDPARLYKSLMRNEGEERVWIPKYSPDGYHWTPDPDNATEMTFEDDAIPPMWDPQAGRWVFYRRMRRYDKAVTGNKGEYSNRIIRLVGISLSEGEDITKWHPKTRSYGGHQIILPDELDAREADRRGALWGEFYAMLGWPYEGIWLGGVEILWRTMDLIDQTGRLSHVDGYQDMHLVWSRDLINWERKKDRVPLIPLGPPGAWDSGMIYGIARPVIKDDEIWFYYDAFDCTHFSPFCFGPQWQKWMEMGKAAGKPSLHQASDWRSGIGAIGLAKLRLDGFAHLETGHVAGIITTKPLVMTGQALGINATVDGGDVRVEIRDESGTPIPGYTLEDCDAFVGDSVRHEVSWQGQSDLSGLRGRVVQLHFRMQRARLYSFWLVDGGEASPTARQRVDDALEAMPFPQVDQETLPPWLRSKVKPTY